MRNALVPLSLLLGVVSAAMLLKGTIQFFAPNTGQDFWYRWSAQQYVMAGIDPFTVAFFASDNDGRLPTGLPPDVVERAGNPVSVVDPPWAFAFGILLYPPSRVLAPIWFIGVQYFALVVTACCILRLTCTLQFSARLFCLCVFFTNLAFGQTILNGNLGIIAVAAIAVYFAANTTGHWWLSGVGLAVSQSKTTIGAPLGVVSLIQHQYKSFILAITLITLGIIWTGHMVSIGHVDLFEEMVNGVSRYSVGGMGPHNWLMALGVHKTAALISSAAVIIVTTSVLSWRWRRDTIAQMAIFAVCSRLFTYHNVIDNVVMGFLVLALAITWLERAFPPILSLTLAGLTVSLLVPARISESVLLSILQQLFWVLTLAVVLGYRRGQTLIGQYEPAARI